MHVAASTYYSMLSTISWHMKKLIEFNKLTGTAYCILASPISVWKAASYYKKGDLKTELRLKT